jgi:hypothetical protein
MAKRRKGSSLGPRVAELRPYTVVVVVAMALSMLLLSGGVAAGAWVLGQSTMSAAARYAVIIGTMVVFGALTALMLFKIYSVSSGRECIRLHANGMVFRGTFSKRAFLWPDVKTFLHVNEHVEDGHGHVTGYRYWWRIELRPNTTLDLNPGLYGQRFDKFMEWAQQVFEQHRLDWNLRYGAR